MGWKRVFISRADIVTGAGHRLQNEFERLFFAVGAPPEAIMYGSNDYKPFGESFYFSPAAVAIAGPLLDTFHATDCQEPQAAGLPVLVMNRGAKAHG